MKKRITFLMVILCILSLTGCKGPFTETDYAAVMPEEKPNVQYFFSAKVTEVQAEYLLLEVFDTGNTNLSENETVEVSTDVVSAGGCPEFVAGEYARVVMARNTDENTVNRLERLEALAIYKTDETGMVTAD